MAHVTIPDTSPRVQYTVGGTSTTDFSIPYAYFEESDIVVYVDDTLKTLTTDYTITGTAVDEGYSGGTVVLNTGVTNVTVTVIRDVPAERITDFPTNGPFNITQLNSELDRMTAALQQEEAGHDLFLKIADYDTYTDLTLPVKDTRKGTVLGFNATTGDPEAGPTIADVSSLASITADIATLADIEDGTDATDAIQTVAGISSNVSTVAGISGNVTTVAGNNANVTTCATNIAAINAAPTHATNAAASATAAASSESNASSSASAAASSATTAASKASDSATSATAAAGSATAAAGSATSAAGSATTATTKAGEASTSATNAASSASAASTSATNAATSETNAGTSATNAASSATAASSSATAAAGSASAAAATFDLFDDSYLGAKASDPSVDNDGDALADGALYFDTTNNVMKVYDLGTTTWFQLTPTVSNQTNINTVAGISANVTTVAGISSDVTAVAADATDIGTVATNITNVNNVGSSIADVNTVATNMADVSNFASLYRIGTTDPTTSLDEGDLFYNTTSDTLKVYNGTAWEAGVTAGSGFLATTGGTMTGAITFAAGQSFDGRDVSADGSKLDGIESGATADQTAQEIATAIDADATAEATLKSALGLGTAAYTASTAYATAAQGALADSALQANQTITLSGDVSGSGTTSIAVTVADDSHNHVISNVDGLQTALDAKAALSGASFTGAVYSTGNMGYDSTDYISWSNNTHMNITINGSNEFRFEADGDFHADGDVIAYSTTTASDKRLKDNISVVDDALSKVCALNGVTFKWKKDGSDSAGVIAQEVMNVLPQAVKEVSDLKEGSHLAVNYGALTSILIEAIKELSAEVEALKGAK